MQTGNPRLEVGFRSWMRAGPCRPEPLRRGSWEREFSQFCPSSFRRMWQRGRRSCRLNRSFQERLDDVRRFIPPDGGSPRKRYRIARRRKRFRHLGAGGLVTFQSSTGWFVHQLGSFNVQGVTGLISKRSASVADASALASFAVTPLAEKTGNELLTKNLLSTIRASDMLRP